MMTDNVLLGRQDKLVSIPQEAWEAHLGESPARIQDHLRFLSPTHHKVRYFVVRELPSTGRPLKPAYIADRLGLSVTRIQKILEDLEKGLFFLVRDDQGDVVWAYPVTVAETPHRLFFKSGEQLYAA
jgi:hypothetical protein